MKGNTAPAREDSRELIKKSKAGKNLLPHEVKVITEDLLRKLKRHEDGSGYIDKKVPVAYAHQILKEAAEQGDPQSAYQAIRLYEKASPKKLQSHWVSRKLEGAYQGAYRYDHDQGEEEILATDEKAYRDAEGIIERSSERGNSGNLENIIPAIISIGALAGGFLFLSSNITGNAISDLSTNTTSWMGGILLVVGLVAGFFWLKNRK